MFMVQLASAIYDRLQDDISREIYINRFAYNITNDYKYIRKIFDCLDITSVLLEILRTKQKIVVFGAGRYGDILVKAFPEFPWVAYIDNDEEKWGTTLHGLPIVSTTELKSGYSDAFVVISLWDYWEDIVHQFSEEHIKNEYFILAKLVVPLSDLQYFDLPYLPKTTDEIFVDVGVLDGTSTLNFIKWANGTYKIAYLFEPNVEAIELIKNNLTSERVRLINKGLWDKDTNLCFISDSQSMGSFSLRESGNLAGATDTVPVTSLDNTLLDVPVTFIKMDIEGSELNALHGGEALIRKYHPKLAICIYHKPEDVIEIPKFIIECYPGYKFYVRHYALTENETVLYAVP